MKIGIFIISAIVSYLFCGLNPAIIFSKLIYHEDIRQNENGSSNPGFTNFKRVYGMKYAWIVFIIDVSKAIVLELLFGYLFGKILGPEYRSIGITVTGLFSMLGHAFPVWYKFKGGKAFLVCISTLYILNWKAGIFATILLSVFLFTTKYMSLSTIIALTAGAIVLPFLGTKLLPTVIFALGVVLVIFRHKENIVRLTQGTERKFSFFKKG